MQEPLLTFDNVSFSYGDDRPALDGISLSIVPGELVGVVGANGSGKSTLTRLIDILILPSSGTLTLFGEDVSTLKDPLTVRRRVGLLFQNPYDQIVTTIVEDDVAFGPENLGLPSEEIRACVDEALAAVGMTEHAKERIDALSGGQQQRVCLAGVLAMRPELLVADEPTSLLDPAGRRELAELLRKLNSQGMTMLVVTHDMRFAAELCSRIVVLEKGRVVLDGTPGEVFATDNAELLERCGLELPEA